MANDGMVSIEVNKAQLKRVAVMMESYPREIPKIMSRAVNKTATTARTQSVRDIARNLKIKGSDLYQKGNRSRPVTQSKATYNHPQVVLAYGLDRIPLIHFKARQTKKGVTYQSGGGRRLIPHAFIQTVYGRGGATAQAKARGGHVAVLKRARETAYPIKELFGVSVGYVLNRHYRDQMIRRAGQVLSKNVGSQIELSLARRTKK